MAEVGVRLVSRRDGEARVELAGSGGRRVASMVLRAGEARTLWLPYRVDLAEPLVGRVLFNDRVVHEHELRSIRPAPPGVPLIIAASAREGNLGSESRFGGADAARLGVAGLPRTVQGYDPVSKLVLDVSVLTRLDGPQLRALEAFIADCGRLTITDLPAKAKPKIQRIAGCGGAFITFVDRKQVTGAMTSAGSRRGKPSLPSASDLWALGPDDSQDRPLVLVSLFLGAYGLLLLVAAIAGRAMPAVLLPIGTAAVALALWSGRTPSVSAVVWLESQPGQGTARFAAVAGIDGHGLGEAVLSLPAGARLDRLSEDALYERTVDGLDRVSASLSVPTRLLSRTTVRLTGTVSMTPPVSITATDNGPVIRNSGPTRTSPGYVAWNGHSFRLPGLEPSAVWMPTDADATPLAPALRRLTGEPPRAVAVLEGADLSQPLLGGVGKTHAWLLIRGADTSERQP